MMRYHIHNKTKTRFVEFIYDDEGLKQAKKLREMRSEYKYQKIKEVLQLYPSQVLPEIEYPYS